MPSSANTPRVTVLMTLYNKGAYVGEAVRSVLGNTFTDLELLVVDDASTDNGLEVVRSVEDGRIRILEAQRNTGRAAAANRGYDAARGEYIAIVDADDIVHRERFAEQVAFLDEHPEVGALGSALEGFGTSDLVYRWPSDDAGNRGRLLFGQPVCYGAAMLRRSIIEEHQLRCNSAWKTPGMDYLFILGLAPFTKYANLQETYSYYRVGEQNMRHGRDPVTDRITLDREVFRMVGLPISEEELLLHIYLSHGEVTGLTADRVRQLLHWVNKLKALNIQHQLFPKDEFEHELDQRWDRLFNMLAESDARAAHVHMVCSDSVSLGSLIHLSKRALRRVVG